jgi:hypothetical protein
MKQKDMERFTVAIPKELHIQFCQKAATENKFHRGWKGKGLIQALKMYVGDDSK